MSPGRGNLLKRAMFPASAGGFDRDRLPGDDRALVIRYYAVAGTCLLIHNAIMIAADSVGISLAVAAAVAFLCVSIFGYLLHAQFTFRQKKSILVAAAYASSMFAGFLIWISMIAAMTGLLRAPMAVAAPTASVIMVAANFLLARAAFLVGCRS